LEVALKNEFTTELYGLRVIRRRRGLSIRSLAEKAGVTPRTVHDLERRVRPAHDSTVSKLAEALDVGRAELISWPEQVAAYKLRGDVDDAHVRRQLVPLMFGLPDGQLEQLLLELLNSPRRGLVVDVVRRNQSQEGSEKPEGGDGDKKGPLEATKKPSPEGLGNPGDGGEETNCS
jgi:transcriptional regulator with XRE-family HTH domain